jgi:hypothetical protein
MKFKRCASAPPEREVSSKKFFDQRHALSFSKAEAFYPTPSPFVTPPRKMAPIAGVKPLYHKQIGNILVYLTPGLTYLANYMSLKKSGWLYDRMKEKLEDFEDGRMDIDILSDSLDPGNLFGIDFFFVLPPGNHKLRRVTKAEFLSYLTARNTSTPVIKSEPDDEASPITIREASMPAQQPDAHPRLVQAYELLLHLMHETSLPKYNNQAFQVTLNAVKKLIDLCSQDFYDVEFLLEPAVNRYLHDHRKDLFLAIKENPASLAIVATRLRDESIMTEAFVHLTGAYHEHSWPWKTSKDRLAVASSSKTLDMIMTKAEQLEFQCLKADKRLFLNSILVESEDGGPCRVKIENHKDTWTVVQIFRDWLAEELDGTDEDPFARGAVYRKLYRGGDAYLDISTVTKMMTELGVGFDLDELTEDLRVIKGFAKDIVAGLCKNNIMLDVEANGIQYLTCSEFGKEDMPWHGNEEEMIYID